jgi:hypothetical protein
MKNYLVPLIITSAVTVSIVILRQKSQAQNAQESSPIFATEIPPGYRDWKVVSVAHEAGNLNDIRAILGNDIAIKAIGRGPSRFRKVQSLAE